MKTSAATLPLILGLTALIAPTSMAGSPPPFVFPDGCCYHDGEVVRTVVPPASSPQEGRDDFFAVSGGVEGQKGIIAVAPGDEGYHGGQWKFHLVEWNKGATPFLLTSDEDVRTAEAGAYVTVTREPDRDFKCPIQP